MEVRRAAEDCWLGGEMGEERRGEDMHRTLEYGLTLRSVQVESGKIRSMSSSSSSSSSSPVRIHAATVRAPPQGLPVAFFRCGWEGFRYRRTMGEPQIRGGTGAVGNEASLSWRRGIRAGASWETAGEARGGNPMRCDAMRCEEERSIR